MKNLLSKLGQDEEYQDEITGQDMLSSQLMKLFETGLKDMYWAEKALSKTFPKMIKNASSEELIEVLEKHLSETEEQISRIEQIFESINKKPIAKKCEAMSGLIKETEEIIDNTLQGPMRDAGIISATQKMEHYEIASYGTLRQFADTLELTEAVELLEETLSEEKNSDERLSEIAKTSINLEAALQN